MRAWLVLITSLTSACGTTSTATRAATQQTTAAKQQGGAMDDFDPSLLAAAGVDPALLHCNHESRWGNSLKPDSEQAADDILADLRKAGVTLPEGDALRKELAHRVFWRMVRAVLLEGDNNNLGVLPLKGRTWTDAHGATHQVVVFRSAVTPSPDAPGSCFRSLLEAGHVRHVVNLFDGEIPVADLVAGEQRAATAAGASYHTASDEPGAYGPWRDLLRKQYDDPAVRRRASEGVARLIKEQILLPDGKPPQGNIHIHCGGGMHRSGMIAGLIERCVDELPWATVEAHYLEHVAWRDEAHPGGREEGNLRFLREFDCSLLTK